VNRSATRAINQENYREAAPMPTICGLWIPGMPGVRAPPAARRCRPDVRHTGRQVRLRAETHHSGATSGPRLAHHDRRAGVETGVRIVARESVATMIVATMTKLALQTSASRRKSRRGRRGGDSSRVCDGTEARDDGPAATLASCARPAVSAGRQTEREHRDDGVAGAGDVGDRGSPPAAPMAGGVAQIVDPLPLSPRVMITLAPVRSCSTRPCLVVVRTRSPSSATLRDDWA
jgi:hypothetical protein